MPTLFGKSLTRRELAAYCSDPSLLFGVDLLECQDGPERGLRVLRFRTGGGLDFDVMLDRAMDIGVMRFGGLPIGWHGPAGFRHGALHEAEADGGLGWARSVCGLMTTCGLDHIHAPDRDTAAHFHYDLKDHLDYPLHGRISFAPARLRAYGVDWDGDEAVVFAEAEIRQATLFGEYLSLNRRIEAAVGGQSVRVLDTVTNQGFDPTPHGILYHVNLGFPVLDPATELWADIADTPFVLRDPDANPRFHDAPTAPFEQRVFEHDVRPGKDNKTHVALANRAVVLPTGARGFALELAYDPQSLPAFHQWQYFQAGNYVTAIEPTTASAGSRSDWIKSGQMPALEAQEARHYLLEFHCHCGERSLEKLAGDINGSAQHGGRGERLDSGDRPET